MSSSTLPSPRRRSVSQAKNWVFTVNNPTSELVYDESYMVALTYQLEQGESGTPHFQGALSCTRRLTLSYLKRHFSPQAHFEIMRGSPAEAHAYASKEESRLLDQPLSGTYKFGDIPVGQGERSDLSNASARVLAGDPISVVARAHPETFVRYHSGLERLRQVTRSTITKPRYDLSDFDVPPLDLSLPIVLSGPTGMGKTQLALAHFERPLFVSHIDQLSDFDDVVHDGIVFDDMSFAHQPATARIHLVDTEEGRYVHVRYRTAYIPPNTRKIFTTNIGMDILLSPTDDLSQRQAIQRRVSFIEITQSLFQ